MPTQWYGKVVKGNARPASLEELRKEFIESMVDASLDDACGFITDVVANGFKGYNSVTEEELQQEWEDSYED